MQYLIVLVAALCAAFTHGYTYADNHSAKYRVGDKLPQSEAPDAKKKYQEIGWNALIPEGWNPMKAFSGIDLSSLSDADPRAMEALEKLRHAWDNAPVEHGWNGQKIRIPGFVVPLERKQNHVTEFLLVPYFGACIHTPPPPANQIIHVLPAKPVKDLKTMDAVWVVGVLETNRTEADRERDKRMGMGVAGYQMKAEMITPYKER
jgi:hypothetical protein